MPVISRTYITVATKMSVLLSELGGIPHFDADGSQTEIASKWIRWKRALELYIMSKGITDAKQKKALLLHCGGMKVQDIFFTLEAVTPGADENVFSVAVKMLDKYFLPKINVPYERHLFRQMRQEDSETVDQFITRLRYRADYCEFKCTVGDAVVDLVDDNIRDQVIDKCKNSEMRRKFLEQGKDLKLNKLQDIARTYEMSRMQSQSMESHQLSGGHINRIQQNPGRNKLQNASSYRNNYNSNSNNDKSIGDLRCYSCNMKGHFKRDPNCPARGSKCQKCHKFGHYAVCCRNNSRNVDYAKYVSEDVDNVVMDSNNEGTTDYAFFLRNCNCNPDDVFRLDNHKCNHNKNLKHSYVNVNIGGVSINVIADSGATCNIIDWKTWEFLKSKS